MAGSRARRAIVLIDHQKLKKRLWGQTVLIDTNIIIYLVEETSPYADLARFVMRNLEEGQFSGDLSLISVAEVMQGPLRKEQPGLAQEVKSYLLTFPNITCQGVDERVLDLMGRDSRVSWKNLRTIDSLIVSCGLVRNATAILSNDLRWKRAIPSIYERDLSASVCLSNVSPSEYGDNRCRLHCRGSLLQPGPNPGLGS